MGLVEFAGELDVLKGKPGHAQGQQGKQAGWSQKQQIGLHGPRFVAAGGEAKVFLRRAGWGVDGDGRAGVEARGGGGLGWRRMRLLDRYQLRELAVVFCYCLAGILVFWLSFELLGEVDELRRRNLEFAGMLLYLWHRLPLYLLLQIPVSLLLSLLYVLTQHVRHNELIAMRAAGIGWWRLSVPYLLVGGVLGLGMLALNEYAVPDAAARADAVLDGGTGLGSGWKGRLNFRDSVSGRTGTLDAFQAETAELRGAHIAWRGEGGSREELLAEHGRWEDGAWVFERVTRFSFSPGADAEGSQYQTNRMVVVDFPETPAHLRSEVKISRLLERSMKSRQVQLSLREILTYRELHRQLSPRFDALLSTWFHDRLATPWTCLVVVLIAIPAGAGSGRRNVFVGVATTLFLAFGFFALREFCLALGSGGYLAAWLAAWAPNLVFGAIGGMSLARIR